MRVQFGQHALDSTGQELFVLDGFDIALLDVAEHLGQGLDFRQGQRAARLTLRHRREIESQKDAGHRAHAHQTAAFPFAVHVLLQSTLDPCQWIERLALISEFKV